MSNVIGIKNEPNPERKISQMVKGEVGYTVPWAFDCKTQMLNENFLVWDKGGTVSVQVECVRPGLYSLTFEEPAYRELIF